MLKTSNNVKLLIASAVSSSATSITLLSASGLPTLSPTDYTIVTLIRNSDTRYEIVKVTEIVGNVLTVVRAQEGTTALTFSGGDSVRNYFTSGMFEIFNGKLSLPSGLADNSLVKLSGTDGETETTGIIVDDSDNVTGIVDLEILGTLNGRDVTDDGDKLDTIEAGATADQSAGEIEAAYNSQVAIVSQVDAQAGTSTAPKRWTPERVKEAIVALTPAPSATVNSEDISQTAHGFVKYDAVYHNGTNFAKALADDAATANVVGVVSSVADVDNFTVTYSGLVAWDTPPTPDYTLGSNVFLSNVTAGLITDSDLTYVIGDVRQFIGTSLSGGLLVNISEGSEITDADSVPSADSWTELAHVQYDGAGVTSFEEDFDCSAYNVVRIKGVIGNASAVITDYHYLNLTLKIAGVEKTLNYQSRTASPDGGYTIAYTDKVGLGFMYCLAPTKGIFTLDIQIIKNLSGVIIHGLVYNQSESNDAYRQFLVSARLDENSVDLDGLIFRCFQSVNRNMDFADFKIYGGDYAIV